MSALETRPKVLCMRHIISPVEISHVVDGRRSVMLSFFPQRERRGEALHDIQHFPRLRLRRALRRPLLAQRPRPALPPPLPSAAQRRPGRPAAAPRARQGGGPRFPALRRAQTVTDSKTRAAGTPARSPGDVIERQETFRRVPCEKDCVKTVHRAEDLHYR